MAILDYSADVWRQALSFSEAHFARRLMLDQASRPGAPVLPASNGIKSIRGETTTEVAVVIHLYVAFVYGICMWHLYVAAGSMLSAGDAVKHNKAFLEPLSDMDMDMARLKRSNELVYDVALSLAEASLAEAVKVQKIVY